MNISFKKILPIILLIIFVLIVPLQETQATSPFSEMIRIILTNFPLSSPATVGSIAALTLVDSSLNSVVNMSPNNIALAIIRGAVQSFQEVARGLLNLCYKFLEIVTSPTFLGAKITSDNDIVTQGWSIVRNLANIALVFGLIVIAISIILGFQEGRAKKTLINFIIIAVLINFTPIICGLIIDASNALMSSFVTGAISSNYFVTGGDEILKAVNSNPGDTNLIVYFVIMSIFYLCCALLIFLYVILFITRYIVLWILVIASPLAFASKVFPVDSAPIIKRVLPGIFFWDEWWKQFLQWCTIGITASFFLYLGNLIGNSVSVVTGKISDVFAYLVPFFFLLCGWSVCISSGGIVGAASDMGAKEALAALGVGALVQKSKAWVKRGATRAAAGATAGALTGIKEGGIAGGTRGLVTGATTATGRQEGVKWFTKRKSEILSTTGVGKMIPEKKKLKDLSLDDLHGVAARNVLTETAGKERGDAINELIKRGEINAQEIAFITSNTNGAKAWGVNLRDLSKQRPDIASRLGVYSSARQVVNELNPKERNKISSAAFRDADFLTTISSDPNYQQILTNKITHGKLGDIENIRNGYVNLVNREINPVAFRNTAQAMGQTIVTPLDSNNLRAFVTDPVNRNVIDDYIRRQSASFNAPDREKGLALQRLSNLAQQGRLIPHGERTTFGRN